MAYDVTAHTPAGWPYITDSDYLRVTPAYTRELANKLENSDADVAAAINAAQQAQAAAAMFGTPAVQSAAMSGTQELADGVYAHVASLSLDAGVWWVQGYGQIGDFVPSLIESSLTYPGGDINTVAAGTSWATSVITTMLVLESSGTVNFAVRVRLHTGPLIAGKLRAVRIR